MKTVKRIINDSSKSAISFGKRIYIILCSSFVWGILAHGAMIFNKFSFHDDIAVFFGPGTIAGGVSQGRWMCGLYATVLSGFFGYDYSLPLYKGLFSFLFIGTAWILLSHLLEINNLLSLIVISGILVVISSITSIFGYIYMALYFTFGLLLSIVGSYFICKGRWLQLLLGSIFWVCAIGTYQLFFATGICVMFIFMYKKIIDDKCNIKEFILSGTRLLGAAVICLAIYMAVTQIVCLVSGIPLTNYKNIDKMGLVGIREYIDRIKIAYGAFFNPNQYVHDIPYPNVSIVLYRSVIVTFLFTITLYIMLFFREKNYQFAVEIIFLTLIAPIAFNLIFMLSGASESIQFYSHVFLYVLFLFLIERYSQMYERLGKWYIGCAAGLLMLLNLFFCRFSNSCYLKAELLQEHAISYFNELVQRIHSIEGYTMDTKVAWIEPREKRDINPVPPQFDGITLAPYSGSTIINDYQWTSFMWIWSGYTFETSEEDFSSYPDVKSMPLYPDEGSIQMIDGVIVVKFGEPEEK